MSELKAYKGDIYIPVYGSVADAKVYLKSEADKVIAELEESRKKEVKELLILNREQSNVANRLRDSMEQVIRHLKHRRCLAMASKYRLRARWFGDMDFYKKEQWALKWYQRWLELAKKFKEDK